VIYRFVRLFAFQLVLLFACAQAWAADAGIEIRNAHIEASEDGYKLAGSYAFELNPELEAAIQHGVPLFFTTEIELTRPRWYWTDERAVTAHQTVRIAYHLYTRQYHVTIKGSVQQTFPTLDEALFLIRRSRWLIASKGALKAGETYQVALRMFMDRQYLQKPLQVNAFGNADWRLDSSKKTFTYKAE
jgi:hypothetical protein